MKYSSCFIRETIDKITATFLISRPLHGIKNVTKVHFAPQKEPIAADY